ncbi:MAG TPA: phenylalanine--tRNA ligase subunit alpha [Anaerolineaceae bacterium]|nr:phenylalanine--tRNA ligase subunit alpha [Anaerolineaceae bacterium]
MTTPQILEELEQVIRMALMDLNTIQSEDALLAWRNQYLGKNSVVMQAFSRLATLPAVDRPQVGQAANRVKTELETAYNQRAQFLKETSLARSLASEALDVTLPGRPKLRGRLHPDTQILRELLDIFSDMGFQVFQSREVETDEYNFQLLNFPIGHPARDMQDTYFLDMPDRGENPLVLRTHTSPGQIRAMRAISALNPLDPPPVRVIVPGMVYRYEQVDVRHETQFDQLEGLAVGEGITFSDLKGTLTDMARRLFGSDARTRFRASYFPFTEPSAEFDIQCFQCKGKGCSVCGGGWLEIGGSGMVHPVVLKNGGYDPERFTGFAFGFGVQRIAMLRYGINDIRYFWDNDLRFLEQF